MHRCAKKVASELKGQFPATYDKLILLPGIGPYTAAAIASIAFGQPAAVVDGNVFRVLARLYGMDEDTASAQGKMRFAKKANELISITRPGDFNQALMEFGATCCTPRNPVCGQCPFEATCVAKANNLIGLLPVKTKKANVRVRHFNYFVFEKERKFGMRKRVGSDIWNGLYDFHLVETSRATSTKKIVGADQYLKSLKKGMPIEESKIIKHILTHQELRIKFIRVALGEKAKAPKGIKFYSKRQVHLLPKPIVISRFFGEK
jgi:A/G-specific adenine glycosylase